jgi:predicted nucleic acid-binding protein
VTTYIDSSALIPIYVPERFSPAARRAVTAAGQVPFTQLHGLEIRNAFELLVGRTLMTRHECRRVLGQLQDDIDAQRLMTLSLDLDQVFVRAGELSARHAARLLLRGLDLLHVAAAHEAACATFVSADDRQLAVARASGLAVVDIKPRGRRTTS